MKLFIAALLLSFPAFSQDVMVRTPYGNYRAAWHKVEGGHVAIIIPGSGMVDRNGNSGNVTGNSLLYLADSLNLHGISTLNTDKLNATPEQFTSDSILTFDAFVDLASRWVDVAVDSGYNHITIIGHSQGALTALLLGNRPEVDKVISLCGAGNRIHDILYTQLTAQIPEQYHEGIASNFDSIRLGYAPKPAHFIMRSMVSEPNVSFIRSWDSYDPCEAIAALNGPVLIISGETDIQVAQSEAERLNECDPSAELVTIEGMGHMLKRAPSSRALATSYYGRADLPLHPELAGVIAQFILD
ncbi:MAG: alpha/beta fold hydrolase [Flavobacteriia bacterium]|nr:alpha/beta fold hydrolase [Flavobacteriia bacterium]